MVLISKIDLLIINFKRQLGACEESNRKATMAMKQSQLSTDVLLKTIHSFRDQGYDYSVHEDDRSACHTIKLADNLLLNLIVSNSTCNFSLQKNLETITSASYVREEILLSGEVYHTRKVVITEGHTYKLNTQVPKFASATPLCVQYLPLNVSSLVTDEFLLKYFSENSVSTPLQDQQ